MALKLGISCMHGTQNVAQKFTTLTLPFGSIEPPPSLSKRGREPADALAIGPGPTLGPAAFDANTEAPAPAVSPLRRKAANCSGSRVSEGKLATTLSSGVR